METTDIAPDIGPSVPSVEPYLFRFFQKTVIVLVYTLLAASIDSIHEISLTTVA